MAQKLLLIEDVEHLGRSGEIVSVREGFARNFLVPKRFAVPADKSALRMQTRLQEERKKKAAVERQEAESTAKVLDGLVLTSIVKVDHEGHMYGSVSAHDVIELIRAQTNLTLEKRALLLKQPIKSTGVHPIDIKLPEGITASITLKVMTEEGAAAAANETVAS